MVCVGDRYCQQGRRGFFCETRLGADCGLWFQPRRRLGARICGRRGAPIPCDLVIEPVGEYELSRPVPLNRNPFAYEPGPRETDVLFICGLCRLLRRLRQLALS